VPTRAPGVTMQGFSCLLTSMRRERSAFVTPGRRLLASLGM
jgi:hypothetical protein